MRSLFLWAALLILSCSARAHRLDECLQAVRIAVSRDGVDVSIQLTPGVAVAAELFARADADNDGAICEKEAERHARSLLRDLELQVDGKRCSLELSSVAFSSREEIMAGEGAIRVKASAEVGALSEGGHELRFQNAHLPQISVYHVNALMPTDPAIQIIRQTRDVRQKAYRLEFRVRDALGEG